MTIDEVRILGSQPCPIFQSAVFVLKGDNAIIGIGPAGARLPLHLIDQLLEHDFHGRDETFEKLCRGEKANILPRADRDEFDESKPEFLVIKHNAFGTLEAIALLS